MARHDTGVSSTRRTSNTGSTTAGFDHCDSNGSRTESGTQLYSHDWRRRSFDPLVKAAGLPRTLKPHRLRHACAVHLLEGDHPVAIGSDLAIEEPKP